MYFFGDRRAPLKSHRNYKAFLFDTLRPRQNGRHFPNDISKCIFVNENVSIAMKISLKSIPKDPINNIPTLVQIMAWRRPGDKPLSEPMMISLPTHICVTRSQWVNILRSSEAFLTPRGHFGKLIFFISASQFCSLKCRYSILFDNLSIKLGIYKEAAIHIPRNKTDAVQQLPALLMYFKMVSLHDNGCVNGRK